MPKQKKRWLSKSVTSEGFWRDMHHIKLIISVCFYICHSTTVPLYRFRDKRPLSDYCRHGDAIHCRKFSFNPHFKIDPALCLTRLTTKTPFVDGDRVWVVCLRQYLRYGIRRHSYGVRGTPMMDRRRGSGRVSGVNFIYTLPRSGASDRAANVWC